MGLGSDTQLIANADGTVDTVPAPRFRVARISATAYCVVDTHQPGSESDPHGLTVWVSEPYERADVEAALVQKAAAQAQADALNASVV